MVRAMLIMYVRCVSVRAEEPQPRLMIGPSSQALGLPADYECLPAGLAAQVAEHRLSNSDAVLPRYVPLPSLWKLRDDSAAVPSGSNRIRAVFVPRS